MAGRVHFVPKETQMSQAITPIVGKIDTTPEPKVVTGYFDFINLLTTTPQARRYCLWTAANSMNNFIIANIQSHLRQERYALHGAEETNQSIDYLSRIGADQKTLDEFNEQQAAIEALKTSATNRVEQGFDAPVDPLDTAETMVALRSFIAATMLASATRQRDLPQPIADSIAYRLRKVPAVDEVKLARIHAATGVPMAALRRADLKVKMSDRKRLLEDAGTIVDQATQLAWKSSPDLPEAEELFKALPVQTQYRLIGNLTRALTAALASEVAALIRYGRMDSVTNRVLINEVLEAYKVFFDTFIHDHVDALADYEANGYTLPTPAEFLVERDES